MGNFGQIHENQNVKHAVGPVEETFNVILLPVGCYFSQEREIIYNLY
jgi:hypothetical protein